MRFVLWFFLSIAYLSIPINFAHPNLQTLAYFEKRNVTSSSIMIVLAMALSLGVFVLTLISILMYFPAAKDFGLLLSIVNSALYFGTILLAFLRGK